MASHLVDICDALAEIRVSFSSDGLDYALKGTPLAKLTDYTPVLPVRLILPPGSYGAGVQGYEYITFTSAVRVTWNIVDVLLFESVALGQTIGLKYAAMAAYVQQYIPAVNAVRKLGSAGMIQRVSPNIGVIEFPRGSGRFYNGVQMVVSVDETIC